MGMASGAYKGDQERARLALQRQQMANQNAQAMANLRMRQQDRDDANALAKRKMDLYERQQSMENDLQQRRLDATIAHQERADALAERAAERADLLMQQKLAQQNQIYSGYEKLAKQAQAQREQKQALGASAVASVMKLAMKSGGQNDKGERQKGAVPMYALEALNRDMGFDGQNQGFVAGGYTQNGDFYLQFAQRDPQSGQMVTRPQIIKPIDQYRIMHQQQGIFDNSDRGAMAAQLKSAGFRDDEILLASGINQTQLEQMRKLAAAKQSQESSMKERLSGLSMIKDFLEKNGADVDEQTIAGLRAAYQNGIQQIAAQFAPKAPEPGVNAPQMNEDGTLTLPNGTTLRKDQEYTNPADGQKYIWRGGDASNFEALKSAEDNGASKPPESPENKRFKMNKAANDAFDDIHSMSADGVRDQALQAQGGYKPEDANEEPGIGPRAGNQPTLDDDIRNSGGMAGGAAGGAGGGGPGGNANEMKQMYERLKASGDLDENVSFADFEAMQMEAALAEEDAAAAE